MKRVIASTDRSQEDLISGALFYLNETILELDRLSGKSEEDVVRWEASEALKLVEKARGRIDKANAYLYKKERGL